MNQFDRRALYEKLYFTELDRREKISARLALPFAVIVANVGLLSWLINSPTKPTLLPWSTAFWVICALSAFLLLLGAWFFRKAWFGHTDQLIPTAGHIEEYHRELMDTYAEYENCDELVKTYFEGFLFNYYINCSSDNAINNDRRSYNIYRSTVSLTLSVLLAFSAAVPYYVGNHLGQGKINDRSEAAAAAAATSNP